MLPAVNVTVRDGGTGIVSPSASFISVVGCSTTGPLNTPTACATIELLQSTFGDGSGVVAAALVLSGGSPVLFTRADDNVDGSHGAIKHTGTSVSVASIDGSVLPIDDAQAVVKIIAGGTIGVAGITYQTSLDAGRSWSKTTKLGTAATIVISNFLKLNFTAAAIVAGDTYEVTCVRPEADGSSLSDAFDALKLSSIPVRRMVIASTSIDATTGGAVDTFAAAQALANRPLRWMGSTRMLNNQNLASIETRSTYATAMEAISDAYSTVYGNIYAAESYQVSPTSGREERRHAMFSALGSQCSASEEVDVADTNRGALTGARVRGLDGNPDPLVYDAEIYGGDLDDLGFATLRGWAGVAGGTFVNNPRILSPHGSDFTFMERGLVMDLAHVTAYADLVFQLSTNVQVNKDGTIAENQARRIEDRLEQKLKQVMLIPDDASLATGKASGVTVEVVRSVNVVSTGKVKVKVRILPNGVVKAIDLDLGYEVSTTPVAA